jgi:predicted nucleotidyltransferase
MKRAKPQSDVDLAVERLGWEAPFELSQSLRELFGRRVDLVDPELVTPWIRDAIERGEVLCEPR